MRAFLVAVVVALGIAVDASFILETYQTPSGNAFATDVPVKPMNEACGSASRMWRA